PRDRERHEGDHARALDGQRHLALVLGAVAADATRNDLAAVGDEVLERLRVLVVDEDLLVGAEAADLSAREAALAAGGTSATTALPVVAFEIDIVGVLLRGHGLTLLPFVGGLLGRRGTAQRLFLGVGVDLVVLVLEERRARRLARHDLFLVGGGLGR